MFNSWVLLSLASLICYGLWGFLGAQASQFSNAKTVFFISCLGTLIAGIAALPLVATRIEVSWPGISLSLLTGLSTGIGTLFFMYALQRGPVIPIVMITALYPVITVFLTYLILNQAISLKQTIGVVLSLVAIYCLSIP